MTRKIALLPVESKYPNLHEITSAYFGSEWFYVNSYLLIPEKYEFKNYADADKDEINKLPQLILDEICKERGNNKILVKNAIQEIDKLILLTVENIESYRDEFAYELRIFDMPFETWQEYKNYLLLFKEKLKNF